MTASAPQTDSSTIPMFIIGACGVRLDGTGNIKIPWQTFKNAGSPPEFAVRHPWQAFSKDDLQFSREEAGMKFRSSEHDMIAQVCWRSPDEMREMLAKLE